MDYYSKTKTNMYTYIHIYMFTLVERRLELGVNLTLIEWTLAT